MRFRPGRRPNGSPTDLLRVRVAVILASGFFWLLMFARPTEGAIGGMASAPRLSPFSGDATLTFASLLLSTLVGAAWFRKSKESDPSRVWNNLENDKATFPGARALVVEHRLPERKQLRQQLESLGLKVAEEGNGSRACDRALNERFDVIFLSLDLPIMNGEAVSKLLRGSGIRTAIVMVCPAEHEAQGDSKRFEFAISQPTEMDSARKVLQAAIPKRLQSDASSTIREDLLALDEAFSSQDFEQLAVIAQKLRDCGRTMGSSDLTNSVERLEACLHEEDLLDSQLMEIRDTIGDLNSLVQDIAPVDSKPERVRVPK